MTSIQAVVFDSISNFEASEIHRWRTHIVSLVSLLHGVALSDLRGSSAHAMPIIEATSPVLCTHLSALELSQGLDQKRTEAIIKHNPEVVDKVGKHLPHVQ